MTQENLTVIVSKDNLFRFAQDCFRSAGFAEDKANLIADTLIEADLRGVNTHGVIRLPMYLNRVRRGLIDPKAEPVLVQENDNMAIWDAKNGMGQPISVKAMEMAIDKAAKSTVAIVGVRNSNHFGAAAYYSMMAADRGMIGICCSNTEPLMPAPGGREAVVGNNPFSFAFPVKDKPHVVVDMAVSAAAIGKIVLAQKKGIKIPLGWAVDKNGKDTTEPDQALDGGLLLPVGGPKGYGLALITDILSGILMGSGFGKEVKSPFTDFVNRQRVGHLFMAINIASFLPLEEFMLNLGSLADDIKESPKAEGTKDIFMPGEIEHNVKQERLASGIPLPAALVEELNTLATELGAVERVG